MQFVREDWQIQFMVVVIFLILFRARMILLFIVKLKILVLIKWSYMSPWLCKLVSPTFANKFWPLSPYSSAHVFLVFVLSSTPNHIPLKCRHLTVFSNWIGMIALHFAHTQWCSWVHMYFIFITAFAKCNSIHWDWGCEPCSIWDHLGAPNKLS